MVKRRGRLTFEQYFAIYSLGWPTSIRPGQHAFNLLVIVRPDLSERIRTTELDPFYSYAQGRLSRFFEWVEHEW